MVLLASFAAASSAAVAAELLSPLPTTGVASERAQLALPSAKQLDFQTNHEKGCFFHVRSADDVHTHASRPHS